MSTSRPNVLFLLSDQHSFRFVGNRPAERGGEPVATPTLDRLADASASFDRTYCSSPVCTSSRLTLLTGRRVPNAGAWGNFDMLKPGLDTLPGTLGAHGYETCLVGKMHFGANRQFGGFAHRPYGDLTGNAGHQFEPPEPALGEEPPDWKSLVTDVGVTNIPESLLQERTVVAETVSFLREHQHRSPDTPWFLCASFSRPHWPRTAPKRFIDRYPPDAVTDPPVGPDSATRSHPLERVQRRPIEDVTVAEHRRARGAYSACVTYLDELLSDLLSTLDREGLLEDTIVVYTSDHGEMAGERALWDKYTYHEASTRVPLFVQLPEHRRGQLPATRFDTPVSLIDLYPTLCGLTGCPTPDDLDGTDLSDGLRDEGELDRGPVVSDCFDTFGSPGTDFRMIRDGTYKYVKFRDAPDLLFDLEADPLEQTDRAQNASGADSSALERLRDVVEASLDFERADEQRRRDRQRLEGYSLGTDRSGPNQYHWPDGRIVDADTPIYQPHVVAERPEAVFDDYPAGTE